MKHISLPVRRRAATPFCLLAALTLIACGSPAGSGAEPTAEASQVATGDLDAVCEAAKDEGTLVFWESEERSILQKEYAEFSKTYPGIELEPVELRPEEIVQRMVTSASAGRGTGGADVVQGNLDALAALVGRELVNTTIDWRAIGIRDSLITDSNMVRSSRIANGLVYNPDSTPESELPDTWEGLIDEKWQGGKVVVDPRGNPLQNLALAWGKDKTIEYVQRLKEVVNPVVIKGGTTGMLTVASGENEVTTNGRGAETREQQAKGSPIEIHYLDIIPTADFYAAVPVDAPHPNAAACWVGWITGPEGAAAQLKYAYKSNEDIPPGAPEGAEVVSIKTPDEVELVAETAAQIAEIWAGV